MKHTRMTSLTSFLKGCYLLSLQRPMLPSVGGFAISSDGYFFFRLYIKNWRILKITFYCITFFVSSLSGLRYMYMVTPNCFSAIYINGDDLRPWLPVWCLDYETLSNRNLLFEKRVCSYREQILSFRS